MIAIIRAVFYDLGEVAVRYIESLLYVLIHIDRIKI